MNDKPRYTPPEGYYFDDPSEKIDGKNSKDDEIKKLASHVVRRVSEWVTRKRDATHRALRSDVVFLYVAPDHLPCKRPSAAWVAQQHGVSRQRASELGREFAKSFGKALQFRGQRFLNQRRRRRRQGG